MKNSHIKPSSFTQLKKVEIHEAKDACVKLAKITPDKHNNLLFELGCKFIEANAPLDLNLLTDDKLGFWDWWYYTFIRDDQNIINSKLPDEFEYESFKSFLIKDEYTVHLFVMNFFMI